MSDILSQLEKIAKNFNGIDPIEQGNPMQREQVYVDFDSLEKKIKDEAIGTVDSVIDFYINPDFRSNNVIIQKRLVDIDNLADIMFCVVSSLYTLKKILSEIDQGNVSPRLIDSQTSLISKKKEYNQQLALMQVYLNDSYKSLANQWTMKSGPGVSGSSSISQQASSMTSSDIEMEVARGPRDILMKLREEISEKDEDE
jgi:hypothetical protein